MPPPPAAPPVFYPARNGSLCALVGTVHIHSRFDPETEASRFVESAIARSSAATIVLGAALGYITRELRRRAPSTRIITVDYHEDFRSRRVCDPDASWYPDTPETLTAFLYRILPEEELGGLAVLDWRPAAQAAGDLALTIAQELQNAISELNANIATSGYFGRRWFRNALANFVSWQKYTVPPEDRRVTVIAASGPSLNRAADLLVHRRSDLRVWALASALTPLLARDVVPDMIVVTDPGFYAEEHLREARNLHIPVAAPFTTARGMWHVGGGIVLLDQGTAVEREIMRLAGLRGLAASPNGTVAGTALELALSVTAGPIVLAGFDLCIDDVISHASPHAFDHYTVFKQKRTAPLLTSLFTANLMGSARISADSRARVARSHQTFAAWFARRFKPDGSPLDNRVFRLLPSPVALPITRLDASLFGRLIREGRAPVHAPTAHGGGSTPPVDVSRATRARKVLQLLTRWIDEIVDLPRATADSRLFSAEGGLRELVAFIDTPALLRIRRLAVSDLNAAVREAELIAADTTQFLRDQRDHFRRAAAL
ncbi:MAG TPA: 6-hydroxymethylpterin diphosphokinase MptE-like protein [Spirochaetia bacterium]|nr:6-hydroxymethylpterin diphosphokinase MptE-like protein [Spirochaetia bacterium]